MPPQKLGHARGMRHWVTPGLDCPMPSPLHCPRADECCRTSSRRRRFLHSPGSLREKRRPEEGNEGAGGALHLWVTPSPVLLPSSRDLEELGQAPCLCHTPGTSPPAAVVLAARGCAKIRAQADETTAASAGSTAPQTPLPSKKSAAMQTLTGFVH